MRLINPPILKTLFLVVLSLSLTMTACRGSKVDKKSKSSKKPQTSKGVDRSVLDDKTSQKAERVIKEAKKYIGTKYKYGGTTKRGMDCSGLTSQSYLAIDVTIPRTSESQSAIGTRIFIGELAIGDLIFFGKKPGNKKITHVGLVSYSKDGKVKFIHSTTSAGVIESDLSNPYWNPRYIKATRPLLEK